jgi:hypothetical protein
MASSHWLLLLWRYTVVAAVAQIIQSLLNSLFFLGDQNGVVGLLGLYVYASANEWALLLVQLF